MRSFEYLRPSSVEHAIAYAHEQPAARFLGGGTNLIDLMKMDVEHPPRLIDVTSLPLTEIEEYNGGVRIGALARNSATAAHPLIRSRYPILSQALVSGASPQIRNMATAGGNLLQRTRCYYFYDPTYAECNKRMPGSGCAAINGFHRIHSILGASDECIATLPSDMAVALTVLDAVVEVQGPQGRRSIPIGDFYRLPGATPQLETNLQQAELITHIDIPAQAKHHAHYLKVRDRQSYAFALVSVAAVMEIGPDRRIHDARFAVGSVAAKPWCVPEAEQALRGKELLEAEFFAAADIALRGAQPRRYNAFKVKLARNSIAQALSMAASGV